MNTLGIDPIPGEKPQGNDPKYEEAYGQMQDEIKKLSFAASGDGIQWCVVAKAATEVLGTLAKDIPAASYLAIALGQTQGLSGWAEGTQVLADLFRHWWETAYPPLNRIRARVNSLDWWQEQSLPLMASWQDMPPYPAETVERARLAVTALDEQIGERLPDHIPLREILEALRRLPVLEPEPAPPPPAPEPEPVPEEAAAVPVREPAPSSAPGTAPAVTPAAAVPPVQTTPAAPAPVEPAQEIKDTASAFAAFHALAGDVLGLLCCQPPAPARLLWKIVYGSLLGKINALPPADGGQTAIPPPDPVPLNAVRHMLAAGNPVAAVASAIGFAPVCPLWLDAQRSIAEGLEACGSEYAEAREVVREECAGLIRRLPGLETLKFADGTPFATTETQAWLETLQPGAAQGAASLAADSATLAIQESQQCAVQGNYVSALEVLEKAIVGQEPQKRTRLRLEQIRLLCTCQRWHSATMLADEVAASAEACQMDEWNPALASLLWQNVYSAWAGSSQEKRLQKMKEAFLHIAKLQPSVAFRMEEKNDM